jgi:hypothetical protein
MYIQILNWLPISVDYSSFWTKEIASNASHCVQLVAASAAANDGISATSLDETDFNRYSAAYYALGPAILDWIPVFMDKVFALLLAKEAPQKGKGGNGNNTGSILGECVELFFQAISAGERLNKARNDPVREIVLSKIIAFIRSETPVNAGKEMAKLIESLVLSDQSSLSQVLNILYYDITFETVNPHIYYTHILYLLCILTDNVSHSL